VCKYSGLEEKKKGPDWSSKTFFQKHYGFHNVFESRRFVAANSFKNQCILQNRDICPTLQDTLHPNRASMFNHVNICQKIS
jgi:hypothetical protein